MEMSMCVSAPERDPSTNRAQSIEIAHKSASLLGSRSRAYRTALSLAFYRYVNVLDGIFSVAETHRFEKGPRSNNGANFKTHRRTVS
jgi:hypothetical protein